MGVKYTKKGLNVKKALMITDSNQACITKMSGCGLQEVIFRKGDEDFTYESTVRDNTKS